MKQFVNLIIFVFFITSCNNNTQENTAKTEQTPKIEIKIPEFNGDSALNFVAKQVAFGPRVPGTKAHENCAAYIVNTLKNYGLQVEVQEGITKTFDNKQYRLKNIIASYKPERQSRIFVSAHWDTRPFADQDKEKKDKPIEGANDGGSGVGILLELARVISINKPTTGIDLIFWDIEDYGQPADSKFPDMEDSYCLGSQYWAKNLSVSYAPKFGINLDMVGAKDAKFYKEANSIYFAASTVEKVWSAAANLGYGNRFINENTGSIIDDHYYVNQIAKIPCIDIIERDPTTNSNFYKHWHTHQDNLSNIDATTLKIVGQTVTKVLFEEK